MKVVKSRYFQKRSAGSGKSGRHRHRVTSALQTERWDSVRGTYGQAWWDKYIRNKDPAGRGLLPQGLKANTVFISQMSQLRRALLFKDLSHGAASKQCGDNFLWAFTTL